MENVEHENVVGFISVFPHGSCICLVMEYVPKDLSSLIFDASFTLTVDRIKKIFLMLLQGLKYCHSLGIFHRDLKPANLLLTNDGTLKIGDFSQARLFDKNARREYSHQVATRWYRAPELLYGSQEYDQAVDLWAAGCILAELYNRFPLFRGDNDIEQLLQVLQILGTPTEETWPGLSELPDYKKITFPLYEKQNLSKLIPDADDISINLLEKLIIYPPNKRITASEALQHSYFFTKPLASCSLEK